MAKLANQGPVDKLAFYFGYSGGTRSPIPDFIQPPRLCVPRCVPRRKIHKKRARQNDISPCYYWSGREDLNLRPPAPKAGALPDCATPRHFCCPHTTVYNRSQALTDKVTAPARAGPSRWRWPVMPHTCLAAVRAFAGWLPQLGACSPLPPAPPADRLPSGVPGERR